MTDRPILFSAPMVGAQLEGRKTQTRRIVAPANCTVNGYRVRTNNPVWKGLMFDHPRCQVRTRSTIMQAIRGADAPFDLHLDVPFLHPEDAARGTKWEDDECFYRVRPIVERGDRLYVREAWRCNGWATDVATIMYRASEGSGYTAMTEQYPVAERKPLRVTTGWRPGIHMPRWISRVAWTVNDVRVERLQSISEADVIAEGLRKLTKDGGQTYKFGMPDRDGLPGRDNDGWPWSAWSTDHKYAFAGLWDQVNGEDAWPENPWVVAITGTVEQRNIDA